jgi:uncharacterized protein involved in exopolysaccharide biosynthesis
MEEEIDLRIYIDVLLRWWWLIALGALVAGVAAFAVKSVMPPSYEAAAGVVSLKSRAEISLGSSFDTVTEEDLEQAAGGMIGSTAIVERSKQRLNTLAGLVRNGAIAQQVALELEDVLPEEERDPASLIDRVRGEVLELDAGGSSDTIQVIVAHRDPETAATIANAWAQNYAVYVNSIYGEATYAPFSDIEQQVQNARDEYDQAQEALLTFLTEDDRIYELQRQIAEEEAMIENLRKARRSAMSAVIDKEVEIKQQLISAYLEDDIKNRLFVFDKGQEATRQILGTWIDAEVQNRVAAINRDRSMRQRMFNTSVTAEIDSVMRVFEYERDELYRNLERDHNRKLRLEGLVQEAYLMRDQLVRGGAASAESNGLALLAFKSRVFSAAEGLPFDRLDIQAPSVDALSPTRTAAEQIADLDALIAAMEEEITALDASVTAQSEAMLRGEGYEFLSLLSPDALAVSASLTGTAAAPTSLSGYIAQRYQDLFEVGDMAQAAEAVAEDTPLFGEIRSLYPQLFAKDPWKLLAESIPADTEVSAAARAIAEDLLELESLEELLAFSVLDTPISEEIAQREARMRSLHADVARLEQVKTDLQQDRDLAWNAYSNLLSTAQELDIAATIESSEVRFASPALAPRNPVGQGRLMVTAIGMALGFMMGVFGAFLFDYIGMESTPRYVWQQVVAIGRGDVALFSGPPRHYEAPVDEGGDADAAPTDEAPPGDDADASPT